ncbi:OmpA family protein [Niabella aquatica]
MQTITRYLCLLALLFYFGSANAQFIKGLGDKAKGAAERTVERRVERETSQKTDEAIDGVLKGKKNKKGKKQETREAEDTGESDGGHAVSQNGKGKTSANHNSDFEPGNKVLVSENFERDAIGDFPAQWNTDASGKIVTLSGSAVKWMELSTPGVFLLETAKQLPENFTLEFDLYVPSSFSYYDYPLWIAFADMKNKNDFFIWEKYKEKRGKDKRNGVLLMLHPQEEGGKKLGYSEYEIWTNSEKSAANKIKSLSAFNVNSNQIKVQVWRQQQRLRVYLDGEKIWDLPRAFEAGKNLNTLLFSRYEAKEGNCFYISNIRLASSVEDARSKILKEGKYSTNAILFSTNSSAILPPSAAPLKEIADILKENPSLKLTIVGHTDNIGKKESNLTLSKQRAASVKNELVGVYGIAANRLNTDGKGDTEPVADNAIPEGRSQNRRVEFLRK